MESATPYRLKNRNAQPVGIHKNMSPKGMFLFSLPFLGIGIYFTLGSLGWVPFDESKVNGPIELITAVGFVFLLAGLMLMSMAIQQLRILTTTKALARKHPDEPALQDYPWDQTGFSPPRWRPVRRSVTALLFFIVFAAIPNILIYESDPAPWLLRLMTILMNLLVLVVAVHTIKTCWHAIKFGHSRLTYPHFPLRPGEKVDLVLTLPSRLRTPTAATFYFRCIKEYYATSGHGKNRSQRLIQEVVYEDRQHLDRGQLLGSPRQIHLPLTIPEDEPTTEIQGDPPHYWELAMELEVPGLDLKQNYLLPVY